MSNCLDLFNAMKDGLEDNLCEPKLEKLMYQVDGLQSRIKVWGQDYDILITPSKEGNRAQFVDFMPSGGSSPIPR